MKNLKLLMLAIAGCVTLASCSDDDNDSNNNNDNQNSDLTGTYRMTSWNAPMAVDFDDNGTSSTNMMLESNCYNNSQMTINEDGTYDMTYNYVGIDGTVSCESETTTGTWTRTGNSFSTTHMNGSQSMNTNYTFAGGSGAQNTTLTRNMSNWDYPSIDTNGNQVYSTGNVNMVMSRQ